MSQKKNTVLELSDDFLRKYNSIPVPSAYNDYNDVYFEAAGLLEDGDLYIEVGAWVGKSTMLLAELLSQQNKRFRLCVVEPFYSNVDWNYSRSEYYETKFKEQANYITRTLFELNMKGYKYELFDVDSKTASLYFEDSVAKFVFIDANHSYEFVKEDLNSWYDKVKSGGILAGHDYTLNFGGVIRAVHEFCQNKEIRYTVSNNSWIIYK